MKKSKLIKLFLIITVCIALTFSTTSTFAANNDTLTQFVNLDEDNDANVVDDGDTTSDDEDENDNSVNTVKADNNTTPNGNSLLTENSNTAGSSKYNNTTPQPVVNTNTNLPKTGVAETGSLVCVIFALVVSAGYAFKKIREYNV